MGAEKKLTPEQLDAVDRLVAEGLTLDEVAARYGMTRVTLFRKRKAAGYPMFRNANGEGGLGSKGYVQVNDKRPGSKYQHRRVLEEKLGRPLRSDELVHHIDGDRSNNEPENLQVMTWREHGYLHASASDPETVAALRADGWGYKRIAKHFGISVAAARERVKRMERRMNA